MEQDINKFLLYLEKDIEVLNEGIKDIIYIPLDDLESSFSIDFDLFVDLTKKYVFKDYKIKIEFSSDKNRRKDEFELEPFSYIPIPDDRLKLFDELFTSRFNNMRYIFFQGYFGDSRTFDYKNILYYRFFYALYHEFMKGTKDLQHTFNELLNQWNAAIENGKIPIVLQIPISEFRLTEDLFYNKKFSLKKVYHTHWINTINGVFTERIRNSILSHHSELSIRIFPSQNGDNPEFDNYDKDFQQEYTQKSNELLLLACAFYLNGLGFKWKDIIVDLPWWFEPELFELNKIEREPISVKYQKRITRKLFKLTLELYQNLKSSEIFSEPFQHLADNYFRIFQNFDEDLTSLNEFILCSSVVLETMFTRGFRAELKFKFSLNGALFFSKKGENLNAIYNFLKFTYDLRSMIVHGDDKVKKTWYDKLINFIERVDDINNLFEWMEKLKEIVNTCLRKLIMLKLDEPRVMTKIEKDPFFFINHSENYKKLI